MRVELKDDGLADTAKLSQAGVDAIMPLPDRVFHLIVGLNADQYAAEMNGQIAGFEGDGLLICGFNLAHCLQLR